MKIKFNLKNLSNLLSKDEMKQVLGGYGGGYGSCGWSGGGGWNKVCDYDKQTAMIMAAAHPGSRWCCSSCGSTSYAGDILGSPSGFLIIKFIFSGKLLIKQMKIFLVNKQHKSQYYHLATSLFFYYILLSFTIACTNKKQEEIMKEEVRPLNQVVLIFDKCPINSLFVFRNGMRGGNDGFEIRYIDD
ncbi:MAG: hypothetical protein M3421_01130, partial [Bacteroidota bacterium]|nr:hypothetical protein [Bacteroidota bacterium]